MQGVCGRLNFPRYDLTHFVKVSSRVIVAGVDECHVLRSVRAWGSNEVRRLALSVE
jgi:hypothetical protein